MHVSSAIETPKQCQLNYSRTFNISFAESEYNSQLILVHLFPEHVFASCKIINTDKRWSTYGSNLMEWHNSPMFALENGHWNNDKRKYQAYLGKSIQKWTKRNLWRTAFWSILEYFVPFDSWIYHKYSK